MNQARSKDHAALTAALLALVAGSFALQLDFAQDDFWIIPSAKTQLLNFCAIPVTGTMAQMKPDSPVVQPVLALLLAGVAELAVEPLAAAPFHLLALLLHALCAFFLCRVLARRTGTAIALAAAALFAINPAGMQAWTWISASGSTLVVLLALLAIDRVDRKPSAPATPWIAGLLAAAAILSQRAGLVAAVLILFITWTRQEGAARRFRWAALFIPALTGLVLFLLGGGFAYTGGTRPGLGAVPEILAALPRLASDLFSARMAVEESAAPLLGLPHWCLVLPWVLLAGAALPFTGRGMLHALGVLAAAALPAALHWSMLVQTGSTASGSRSLYPATAALAFIAAMLLLQASTRPGLRRVLSWCAIALVGLGFVDQFTARAKDELAAATEIRAFRETAASLQDRIPMDAPVLIADSRTTRAGIPLLAAGFLPEACRPPFTKHGLSVRSFADTAALLDEPLLRHHAGPLVIWSRTEGEPVILPALPETLPELVRSGVPDVWMPRAPFPGRALAAIMLRPAPMAPLTGVRVKTDRGEVVGFAQDQGGQEKLVLCFEDALTLLAAEEVISITTHGALDLPPQLLREWPHLEHEMALEPELLLAGTVPMLVSAAWPESGRIRVDCRFKLGDWEFSASFRWVVPPDNPPGTGRLRLPLAKSALIASTQPGFSFEEAGTLAVKLLKPFGLTRIPFRWRATLLAAGSESPVARGTWRDAVLSVAP